MNIIALILFFTTVIINREFENFNQIISVILTFLPLYMELINIIRKIFLDELNNMIIYDIDIDLLYLKELKEEYYNTISNIVEENNFIFKDHEFKYIRDDKKNNYLKVINMKNINILTIFKDIDNNHENLIEFIKNDIYTIIKKRTKHLDGVVHKLNFFEKICLFKYVVDNNILNMSIEEINNNSTDNNNSFVENVLPFIFYVPMILIILSFITIGTFLLLIPGNIIKQFFCFIEVENDCLNLALYRWQRIAKNLFIYKKTGFAIMGFNKNI